MFNKSPCRSGSRRSACGGGASSPIGEGEEGVEINIRDPSPAGTNKILRNS